jgi:hypothetical protein
MVEEEIYEFRNLDGSIIRVTPHEVRAKDLDQRTRVMIDLLLFDMDNARYNEYRTLMTVKLYTKCLRAQRDDLCEVLGESIGTLMTRKIQTPKVEDTQK